MPCHPWNSYLGALACTWLWVYLAPGTALSVCPAVSIPVPHQEPYLPVPDKVQLLGWLENCSNCSLNSSSFLMVTISVLLC